MFASFTTRLKLKVLTPALCVAALSSALAPVSAHAFAFFDVLKQARSLAQDSYKAPVPNLPDALKELKYAGYQQVRFPDDRLHWRDANLNFKLSFYHEGMHFGYLMALKSAIEANKV